MKTGEDFRREFPEAEEGFLNAVHHALQGQEDETEVKRMKIRPILVIALLLVMLMGVSVAATWERWSLDDFIPKGRITATEDEWKEMIAAFEPVSAKSDVANVTVREALYDGYALYIVMDVDPLNAQDFFVPEMTDMDAAARKTADALPEDMTLRDYAAAQGYTRTLEVLMSTGMRGIVFLPEMELNEDGTMTFYLRQRIHPPMEQQREELQLTLHVTMRPKSGSARYYAEVPLTLQRLPVLEEAVSPEGERHAFADSGVVMSNVHLIRTPLSTYVTVEVEEADEEQYERQFGDATLCLVSTEGREYEQGPFNLCGFVRNHKPPRAKSAALYYLATLTLEEIPEKLYLNEMPMGVYDPDKVTDSWLIPLEKVN